MARAPHPPSRQRSHKTHPMRPRDSSRGVESTEHLGAPASKDVSTAVALTQPPELRERVHNKEAVIRLLFHHRVQPEVQVREFRQGVEPQHFCQRGDAVVVEIETLQRSQVLDALSAGQNAGLAHTSTNRETGHQHKPRPTSQMHLPWPHAAARKSTKRDVFQAGGSTSHTHETAM